MITQEEIERVRNKNRIEIVIAREGIELKKRGSMLLGICPFHDDHHPSLQVYPAKQRWSCHVCDFKLQDVFKFISEKRTCNFAQAFALLGGTIPEKANGNGDFKAMKQEPAGSSKEVAVYEYLDAQGGYLFEKARYENKDFVIRRKSESGIGGIKPVLYNLPEVLKEQWVWVVEGEKDADNLSRLGMCATTNPYGAREWQPQYSEALKGKDVVLCGDNDEEGIKHIDKVEAALAPLARTTRRVTIPAPHKDVSDYLSLIENKEKARTIMWDLAGSAIEKFNGSEIPLRSFSERVTSLREFARNSKDRCVDLSKWLSGFKAIPALVPGELAVFLASTGEGKTAALQGITLAMAPLPIALFELELPETILATREISLITGISANQVWATYTQGGEIDFDMMRFNHVYTCDKSGISVSEIKKWVDLAHLKTGKKPVAVVVDYVGKLKGQGRSRYESMTAVAQELKDMAKATNTVVIVACQVNREDADNKTIGLYSAKDSGDIENSAGLLVSLARDENDDCEITIVKSTRGGAGSKFTVRFDGPTLSFHNL